MFENNQDVISHALRMWANYIETSDPVIGATDAINMNERDKIQALNDEQRKFVVRLRDLADAEMMKR